MAREDFKFSYQMRVRYSEIDHQGVVFNGHYLTYFDVGHTEYMRALGMDYSGMVEDTGVDFHLAKATVEYKKPIPFDMMMDICVRVGRIGRSSVLVIFEIYEDGTDTLLACGEKVDVCVNLADHRPVPVPDVYADALRVFEGSDLSG